MRLKEFLVETWLNPRAHLCKYNFGSSCVKAFTVEELCGFVGLEKESFLEEVWNMSLHYGHFFGYERLLCALAKLYRGVTKDMIWTVHGGTGANNMVITELVEPGDNVVAFLPNYQQHYAIPESLGAEVRYLELLEKDGYLPDLNKLEALIDEKTRLITLSNPNNPTGAFIAEAMLNDIAGLADKAGAYILVDEIYRGLNDEYMPSIVDVYERGIATSSTSKVFSMAGTRVGWIVTKDKDVYERIGNRRSFDTICDGVFDETVTAIALEHADAILERSKKIVRENRAILDEWLKTQPHLSCTNASATSTAFIKFDYDVTNVRLAEELYENASVLVCHGDCFEIPKAFRLGYGYVTKDVVRDGLKALGDCIQQFE